VCGFGKGGLGIWGREMGMGDGGRTAHCGNLLRSGRLAVWVFARGEAARRRETSVRESMIVCLLACGFLVVGGKVFGVLFFLLF